MIGNTLLVINPVSGKGEARFELLPIVTRLSEAGCEVTVFPTRADTDNAEEIASRLHASHSYDMVVAVGGDGTLNLTVEGVLRSAKKVPIGYIPLGTTNDFASSLGIPSDTDDAIAHVLAGEPVPHDIGLFGDRHFTYIACCGAFTESSYSTNQTLKSIFGHAAYVFGALPSLASIRPIEMTVKTDCETITGKYLFCALSNTTTAGGFVKLDGQGVDFSDGLFELILIGYPQDLIDAGRVAKKLATANMNDPLIVIRHITACEITLGAPLGWSLDGEDGGKMGTVHLSVQKSAIEILK